MAAINIKEKNYIRLLLLLSGTSTRAVRAYFDQQIPPTDLYRKLNQKKNLKILNNLRFKKRIINASQWSLLFPKGGFYPDSVRFDVTLMTCLIRNLLSVNPPKKGFDKLPLPTETFPGADLARIKHYRNYLAHLTSSEIDTSFFDTAWREIADAVGRLGGQTLQQECQDLKSRSLDSTIMETLNELVTQLKTLERVHDDTVPWNIRDQIKKKLETWKLSDQAFVNTRAAKHVFACIEENSCVTITGSSGMGKTATARHVALQMKTNGYDLIPVKDPSDIVNYYSQNKLILFLVDDFCGTYTLNPVALEKWKSLNEDITGILENKKIKILVTCRLQIYHDEKLKSVPRPFQSCECNLLSESICLLPEEKMSIATAYLKTDAPKIDQYAKSYDFFPLLCRLYNENPAMNISDFFTNPFTFYESEIDKSFKECAYGKYSVLALCVMFNNTLMEDWFTEDVPMEIRQIMDDTLEACRMNKGTSRLILKDELDSLLHTFFKLEDGVYKTIHDKLFDFIVFYFGNKMLTFLIRKATSRFIRERFILGIIGNDDQYKIFIPDRYEKAYIERLFNDWEHGKVVDVFFNTNMKKSDFRRQFRKHLKSLDTPFQKRLAYKCDVNNNDTILIRCCFIGETDLIQWCFSYGVDINQGGDEGASPLFVACQEGYGEIVSMLLEMGADIEKCTDAGASPLFIACQMGHCEIVTILLQMKVDIDKCMNDGATPLFIACQRKQIEVVKMLLEKEADINKCLSNGQSPVFTVCDIGHIEIVKMLLEKNANIDKYIENGASPLFMACQKGHKEIVDMLLEKKADINKCIDAGASSLFIACQNGHTEIVNMLLQKNPDINIINKCMDDGASPLARACQNGHTDIVKMLLEKNADTNKCMNDSPSPLLIACEKGHREIVTMLLDKQAVIGQCTVTGASPLFKSCQNGYMEIVRILLDRGANFNKCTELGASPLLIACHEGHGEIVNLLLEKNADISKCARDGQSPLFMACQNGYSEIMKTLLHKKVDINQRTSNGASPLLIACEKGHKEIVHILLDMKANIRMCMYDGRSPIFIACENGRRDIFDILLHSGADINKNMKDGSSPLYVSCQNGHREIVKVLLEIKVDINKCRNNGASPLFIACECGQKEIVNLLLEKKADINKCKKGEASPLLVACEIGDREIVNMLVDRKADINKSLENGVSPLYMACQNGHKEIVGMLLEKGADVNQCLDNGGSPLSIACQKGHTEIVYMLRCKNPDIARH